MKQNVTGSKIREIRKSKKITQEMMIARLQSNGFDMSRSTYSKVELEIRQVRDFELIAFATALDVNVSLFFE
ncbi:hypothetical protein CKF94_17955 [Vibrio coralliilyticus]|uniref:helix-turn-helix domain-containing protein n=1 Tax=Vibrio coralliilyticus TaxID=190893 RepID=UPI000BAAE27C|nr:helix-turn-helix transcriptional regulator [Vibrio coralliilyticus]PAU36860.1 hypothetical protein CKF94_17955 [Vibrio coralliilyticus]